MDVPPTTPRTVFWKIDNHGVYQRFCGLTFIVPLPGLDEFDGPWATLMRALAADPVISRYFAPLPLHSLHITVKNHETAMAHAPRGEWDRWFEKVLLDVMRPHSKLREMMDTCSRMAYIPVARPVNPLHAWSPSNSTLSIDVQLSLDPEPLRAALVQLGSRAEPNFVFHITLAYRFCSPSTEEEHSLLALHLNQLHALATALVVESPTHSVIECQTPVALYYFPSMCEFIRLSSSVEEERKIGGR